MNVNQVELTVSAVSEKQYPPGQQPEIAFAGRSNVGKSSLLNKLVNRKALARVSASPGKTATINFYQVEKKLYFVDLPGYGFAKVSKQEKQKWGEMIDEYLNGRQELKCIFLLVDSRHKPSQDDMIMLDYVRQTGLLYAVIATKTDKMSKTQCAQNLEMIKSYMGVYENFFPFSAKTGQGKEEIWEFIEELVEQA